MRGLMYKQIMTFRQPTVAVVLFHLYFAVFMVMSWLDAPEDNQNIWAVLDMIVPFMIFSVCNGELFRCDEREK